MTPEAMARLHARAFAPERGWTAGEFAALCSSKHVHVYSRPHAFAVARIVADETELLTLAVDPDHRRLGMADALLQQWMAQSDAQTAFLEVAGDNEAAKALYNKHGFVICGRRKGYYARPNAVAADALLMRVALTPRRPDDSTG